MRDAVERGRHVPGLHLHPDRASSKLTEAQARAIKFAPAGGTGLAKQFGVSYDTIKAIRAGRSWAWIT